MLGPIFMRELVTVPRRDGHFLTRMAVLVLLLVLGITAWQAGVGFQANATLGETAQFGLLLFQIIAFVELTLLLFFAALSAANAVAQEKDRRTFVLLLLTDMRDYEIVLGKMLGSLLPILILFLVTLPVLSMLLLLGGISAWQVGQAALVMAATALAAGSLGGLIALWRERTFQSLALAVLVLVLYLCVVQGIGLLGRVIPGIDWVTVSAWLDPFRAMQTVLEPPQRSSGLAPAYGFCLVMLGWSMLLNGIGVARLRVWNPSGEPIMQRDQPSEAEQEQIEREKAHAAPGELRTVWENPILWREILTQAYGKRPILVKVAYAVVLALIVYFAVDLLTTRPAFVAAYGLVPVMILSLLLVAAQAVTAITSERDGRSLDLLLVTDLTPREFVFGKIGGVLYNTKEFLLPPILLTIFYALSGVLTNTPADANWTTALVSNFGSMVCVLGGVLILLAFALTLGIHVALRNASSRLAIANTLGTVFFLSVGTLIVIYLIVINGGSFANQWISFLAFLGLGIGGLWWVLSADRPSPALTLASWLCPLAMFYCVTNILIAKPGSEESTDPLVPFLVIAAAFGFTISAMLTPLLSEFDVALGRTTANEE